MSGSKVFKDFNLSIRLIAGCSARGCLKVVRFAHTARKITHFLEMSFFLDRIAPLVADPSRCNFSNKQNSSNIEKNCITFEPMVQFWNPSGVRMTGSFATFAWLNIYNGVCRADGIFNVYYRSEFKIVSNWCGWYGCHVWYGQYGVYTGYL